MFRPVPSVGLRLKNSPPQHGEGKLSNRMKKIVLTIQVFATNFPGLCKVT